jgi:hypothetical protein
MEQVTEERKTAMYWQFFQQSRHPGGPTGETPRQTAGGTPALLPRILLKTGEFRLQDIEVMKHGKPTILAGENKERDESARLIVRRGSGKKLAAGDSER